MLNNRNSLNCTSNDCFEDRFYWHRIRATNISSIPPVTKPNNSIISIINRYFYIVPSDIHLTNGTTLLAHLFSDDNGNMVNAFQIFNPNGYVNLYINAVMQKGGIYTVTQNALIIQPLNSTISARTPIIIESLGFL